MNLLVGALCCPWMLLLSSVANLAILNYTSVDPKYYLVGAQSSGMIDGIEMCIFSTSYKRVCWVTRNYEDTSSTEEAAKMHLAPQTVQSKWR